MSVTGSPRAWYAGLFASRNDGAIGLSLMHQTEATAATSGAPFYSTLLALCGASWQFGHEQECRLGSLLFIAVCSGAGM